MKQNSFQKNSFLNINNKVSTFNQDNYGRRSIQDVRDDMWNAKKVNQNHDSQLNNSNPIIPKSNQEDHRQRVENMKNFNRWK